MPNAMTQFGFVKKSGDTMTGALYFENELYKAGLRVHGTQDYSLEIIDSVGNPANAKIYVADIISSCKVQAALFDCTGSILMDAGYLVDGIDVSEIHQAKIKTGTYVGNGVDNRNIDIGVDLASKSFAYVVIKAANASIAVHRFEYSQGDLTMAYDANADNPDRIQAFTSTGFQVGLSATVNTDTVTYRYVALWSE